jgi:Lrp/AsnC family transcriptional regulator
MTYNLDSFDKKILKVMQMDASLPTADIAEKVGLSQSPCWRRIQKMREAGVIKSVVALLDRRKLGLNAQVFAQVKLSAHGRTHLNEFISAIRKLPQVLEAYVLMGETDFMLRIVTADIDAYEKFFFDHLSKLPGVQEIKSTMALSEIKWTTELPLGR